MPLTYNGQLIEPAPLVSIGKNYVFSGDETPINVTYDITLTGTLLPDRGSPNSSGVFATTGPNADEVIIGDDLRFASIYRKQEAIRNLFSTNGHEFVFVAPGQAPVKCYPTVRSITFPEEIWVNRSQFTITLTASRLFGPSGEEIEDVFDFDSVQRNLVSVNDDWTIEEDAENDSLYILSHTLSATGRKSYAGENYDVPSGATEPWEWAKAWVISQIGSISADDLTTAEKDFLENKSLFSFDFGGDVQAYNRVRSETINRTGGSYSITDRWELSDDGKSVIEEYTVEHSSDTADIIDGENKFGQGLRNIYTISGNIRGLTGSNATKYDNAKDFLEKNILNPSKPESLIKRIKKAITGNDSFVIANLSTLPVSSSISRDEIKGLISYNFSFSDRPLKKTGLSSQISRYDISVSENGGSPTGGLIPATLAIIAIPGKANGPIIQNMGTRSAITRTVSASIFYSGSADTFANLFSDTQNGRSNFQQILINENIIPNQNTYDYWVTSFNDDFNWQDGVYNASLTYTLRPKSGVG